MAYTITNSDGSPLTIIADGTLDTTSTGLSLPGPNFVGYGQFLNQNLVNLLENFASNTAPFSASQIGQIWFDKTHQVLNVFTNTGYTPVSGIIVNDIQPLTGLHPGTIWFNTVTGQVFIYTPTNQFELLGPIYTNQQGISGAIPVAVADANVVGLAHNILKLQFGNIVIATFSSDTVFSPSPTMSGFPAIYPGLTINSTLFSGMAQFYTNANVAVYLPTDPTIIGINANAIVANNAVISYVNTQTALLNNSIISNTASTNANIVAASNTANIAIISNTASTNANIVAANIAMTGYVSTQIAATTSAWTANAQSQEGRLTTLSGNIATTNSIVSNITANVTTLQTQVYANANVASYLPTYAGNIAAGNIIVGNVTTSGNIAANNAQITIATVGNATVGNLTVSGRINGATQVVTTSAVTNTPSAIFTGPTYCNFCLVTGNDGAGNYFSDVVLMSTGSTTVNVISSLIAAGAPAARTYSATSANLRLAMASGTYTVKTVSTSI